MDPLILDGVVTAAAVLPLPFAFLLHPRGEQRCALLVPLWMLLFGMSGDWFVHFVMALAFCFVAVVRPAGLLQLLVGGGFLAIAQLNFVYGLSVQGAYADQVKSSAMLAIVILQSLFTGVSIVRELANRAGFSVARLRAGMVRMARLADLA